jgi:hypothetical protein
MPAPSPSEAAPSRFWAHPAGGKSTTAAALHALGHSLVADDNVAISLPDKNDSGKTHSGAVVLPAFPQIKLWPDSALALRETVDDLPRLHPEMDKRAVACGGQFRLNSTAAAPCVRVAWQLRRHRRSRDAPPFRTGHRAIKPARGMHRTREAHVLHASGRRPRRQWNGDLAFAQCAELAQKVSVCRLRSRHATEGLSALPRLANLILDDLENAEAQTADSARDV